MPLIFGKYKRLTRNKPNGDKSKNNNIDDNSNNNGGGKNFRNCACWGVLVGVRGKVYKVKNSTQVGMCATLNVPSCLPSRVIL